MVSENGNILLRENEKRISEPCLVCGNPTSTTHFQINVCYACAAFYRRSVNSLRTYTCQRNTGNCDVTKRKPGKPSCRYCRYQKCNKVGMKLSKENKDNEMENKIKIEEIEIFQSENNNFDNVFKHVLKMFKETPSASIASSENYTNQFNNLLSKFLETTKPLGKLIPIENDAIRKEFVKNFYFSSAKMLLNYQPYLNLSFNDKVTLHNKFWIRFHFLERAFLTCQYYGVNLDDGRLPVDNYQYINTLKEEEFLKQGIYQDGCAFFLVPLIQKSHIFLMRYKKINPTFYEFAYLCQMLLWTTYDLEVSESTHHLAEKIQNKISENLHSYYTEKLRMNTYATRQAQLFRILHSIEVHMQERKQIFTATEIFDFNENKIPFCQFELNFVRFFNKLIL